MQFDAKTFLKEIESLTKERELINKKIKAIEALYEIYRDEDNADDAEENEVSETDNAPLGDRRFKSQRDITTPHSYPYHKRKKATPAVSMTDAERIAESKKLIQERRDSLGGAKSTKKMFECDNCPNTFEADITESVKCSKCGSSNVWPAPLTA